MTMRLEDRDFEADPCIRFAQLHIAICRGDASTAKEAARELRKLGYEVTVTPARAAELASQHIDREPQDEIPPS